MVDLRRSVSRTRYAEPDIRLVAGLGRKRDGWFRAIDVTVECCFGGNFATVSSGDVLDVLSGGADHAPLDQLQPCLAVLVDSAPPQCNIVQPGFQLTRERPVLRGCQCFRKLLGPAGADNGRRDRRV
jgi:hypothetical protein